MAAAGLPNIQITAQLIPADPGERLALAAKAWTELKRAETEVARIEAILVQGEFAARRHGLTRADQFAAWARKSDAERLLVACLEFGQ